MQDLIIIGAGPAGITAGIYAARQGLKTLLITKELGGQLMKKAGKIENYPGFKEISGADLIKKFESHLEKFPILEMKFREVERVEKKDDFFYVITTKKETLESKAVILATGSSPKTLKVPGEKEFVGKGISYCAICDGPFFKNKKVAVVGGGNSGFETALFLAQIAKKVYILEASEKVRADKENQEKVKTFSNVQVMTKVLIKEIKGEKFVKGILYFDKESQKENFLEVEGVFVEIGLEPNSSIAKDLVDFNERKEILVNLENFQTKTPGLFAVGDVKAGEKKQIIIACGEGAKAALYVNDYLQGKL